MNSVPQDADSVIALGRIDALRGVSHSDAGLRIGALTTLDDVGADPDINTLAPAVAAAAISAASPPIRRRATLGGNLLLDVRCRYVDQSALFRTALGGCLKSHGAECHVVPGGRTCVAALCADTVAPMVAHGATIEIAGEQGRRTLPLADLYDADGCTPARIGASEILCAVTLPTLAPNTVVASRRWALRKAIDFPLISVAARVERNDDGEVRGGAVVVTALGPQPRITALDAYVGHRLDDETRAAIVAHVLRRSRTLPNLPFDAEYRHERLGVELARLLRGMAVMASD